MKFLISLIFFSHSLFAHADNLKPFTLDSTTTDFALACQWPGKKSDPQSRLLMCISYIESAKGQVAINSKNTACYDQLKQVNNLAIMDALFINAYDKKSKHDLLFTSTNFALTTVAKACDKK